MTTIDSDSESQDSDDGRRFRFEATRKDDTLTTLDSRNKRRGSPPRKGYGSSFREKSSRARKKLARSIPYRLKPLERDKKESKNNYEKRRDSKDRESNDRHDKGIKHPTKVTRTNDSKTLTTDKQRSVDSKYSTHRDSKDPKTSSSHKDVRDSRDSWSRESKSSGNKDLKNTSVRDQNKDSKDSRDRDRDRKRSRSRERSAIDRQRQAGVRSREGHGIRSRERSGDRSNDKPKERSSDRNGSTSRDERDGGRPESKRIPRRDRDARTSKRDIRSPTKILEQIGSDSEPDLGALDPDVGTILTLDKFQECSELNLSDFDIVSDTGGSCSDGSATGALDIKEREPRVKKLVSRRQYERLVRRQTAKNRRRVETQAQRKVNPRNGDHHHAVTLVDHGNDSNSNPSAVSDSLLGTEMLAASTPAGAERRAPVEHRKYQKTVEQDISKFYRGGDRSRRKDKSGSVSEEKSNLIEGSSPSLIRDHSPSHTDDQPQHIYGPVLPPGSESLRHSILQNDTLRNAGSPPRKSKNEVFSNSKRNVPAVSPAGSDTSNRCDKNSDADNSRADGAVYGPCLLAMGSPAPTSLPYPNQVTNLHDSQGRDESLKNCESVSARGRIIGPSLPPYLRKQNIKSEETDGEDASVIEDCSMLGPALPPHLLQKKTVASDPEDLILGPVLPDHLRSSGIEEPVIGLARDSESEDDFVVGPLPPDHPAATDSYVQQQLEARARRIKDQLRAENEPQVKKREEWMLELPSAQAKNLGMSARQFRARAAPDMSDRSSWTDTPADKVRKQREKGDSKAVDLAKESETLAIEQRDQDMQLMAEKHKSRKRQESLVDIHQKKLQKKKKKEAKAAKEAKEAGKPTRRPFDRDIDLQANRFDEAQKKSILKKAQLLDDRFSRGKSKFL